MTSTAPPKMLCGLHHTLHAGAMKDQEESVFCHLCCDISNCKAPAAMHCPECKEIVCEKCLPMYKDIGFAMFLSHEKRSHLIFYEKSPQYTAERYRCPWALQVYNLHQEYNDTDEYRAILAEEIARDEQRVWSKKRKLAASMDRAAKACSGQ